jgi:catechol 2,3-dioxygenase-like lactoylglutathione lyase family enzyme
MTDLKQRVTGVLSVAVAVSDLDNAIDFYVGTLGLEKRLDAVLTPGFRWVEVAAPGAATAIALAIARESTPAGVDTGIRVSVGDAEAFHSTLQSAGADVDEILRWPGVPAMFSFRDPDGNVLYTVEQPAA